MSQIGCETASCPLKFFLEEMVYKGVYKVFDRAVPTSTIEQRIMKKCAEVNASHPIIDG